MGVRIPPKGEMDHELIQENEIFDHYLAGKLSPEERVEFEEHFLDCSICLGQLEALEGLRDGLRELSSRGMPASQPRRHALVRLLRDPRAAALLAAACLAVAVVPPVFYLGELRRTRAELENARRASDEAQRKNAALNSALERERTAGASVASGAATLAASVFTLNLTRGAGTEVPGDRILLRDPREWIILLLDRPEGQKFESYRARISTADRRVIGEALSASPASDEMLAVGLPPGLLFAGDYALTLEGAGAGPARALATYRFRAVLRK
jgi:hypothetical protein